MAEPLKNLYTEGLIRQLAKCLHQHDARINQQDFLERIFSAQWPALELKQRMRHITLTMKDFLPEDYLQTLPILVECSQQFKGFETMFFPEYVELFGQQHFEPSMQALEVMTEYSSSEFAVRPYIIAQPDLMMKQMLDWSHSPNLHVRRLATEGCRLT